MRKVFEVTQTVKGLGYHEKIAQLADWLRKAKRAMALTGAGISTESGIPDFRSPGTGLWEKVDPMAVLSVQALRRDPRRFYREGFSLFISTLESAQPNPAHQVLAWLEEKGFLAGVITQNVDGLHQKAGSRLVFEVHGHMRSGHCLQCRHHYDMQTIVDFLQKGEVPPLCTCGGVIRPDVTLFGDPMPPDFWRATQEAEKCDLLLVMGSSLVVAPANTIPELVERVAIINLGGTGYDYRADLIINEKASKALLDLKAELEKDLRRE